MYGSFSSSILFQFITSTITTFQSLSSYRKRGRILMFAARVAADRVGKLPPFQSGKKWGRRNWSPHKGNCGHSKFIEMDGSTIARIAPAIFLKNR
jgi:hypothetical protein